MYGDFPEVVRVKVLRKWVEKGVWKLEGVRSTEGQFETHRRLESQRWAGRDGSLVESTVCSYRGPEFASQHRNSAPKGSDALFWSPQAPHMYMAHIHTYRKSILTHKIKCVLKNSQRLPRGKLKA